MDLQLGDMLIHLDKTIAILLIGIPMLIILRLPLLTLLTQGLKKLVNFHTSRLGHPDEEDEEE